MTRHSLTVRAKLLLAMMSTSLVGLVFVGGALLQRQYGAAQRELSVQMTRIGDIVAASNLAALRFEDRKEATASLGVLAVDERVVGAGIYTANGGLLAVYTKGARHAPPLGGDAPFEFEGTLVVSRSMMLDGERIGTLVIQADPATVLQRFMNDATYLLLLTVMAAGAAFGVALALQRVIAAPLLHLASQAQVVSTAADYSIRVHKRSNDELGTLYDRFNEMLAHIQARDAALQAARDDLERRVDQRTVALSDEIVERKRTEAQLIVARDAAESASRAKSVFLANMSHELRTPLNAIIGYSELLLEDQAQAESSLAVDLRRIRVAGRHLLQLINDVLDLSKIEAGKMEVCVEHAAVRPLVHELVATVAPSAAKNGNVVVVDLETTVDHIETDGLRLRQALLNLLANACKFTHNGTVTIAVRSEARSGGRWMSFSVIDTGIGLSAEHVDRIFEPFVQADGSTTRTYGGTGLGLSITRRLCRLLGGELHVASAPGTGSTFTFALPVHLSRHDDDDPASPVDLVPAGAGV